MNSKEQVVTKIKERGNVQKNKDNFRVLKLFCVIYYKWWILVILGSSKSIEHTTLKSKPNISEEFWLK